MARRIEPSRKRPLEVLADVLSGHREANIAGPVQARKYLERVLVENKSIPNATKFFLYDLLAEACHATGEEARAREAVDLARQYVDDAREEAPREWKEHLPELRFLEISIALASDEGRFEEALADCETALKWGLGKAYEAKATSLRRMI